MKSGRAEKDGFYQLHLTHVGSKEHCGLSYPNLERSARPSSALMPGRAAHRLGHRRQEVRPVGGRRASGKDRRGHHGARMATERGRRDGDGHAGGPVGCCRCGAGSVVGARPSRTWGWARSPGTRERQGRIEPRRSVAVELGPGAVIVEPGAGVVVAAEPRSELPRLPRHGHTTSAGAVAASRGHGAGTSVPPLGRSTAAAGHEVLRGHSSG